MSVYRVAATDSSTTLSIRCDPLPLLLRLSDRSQPFVWARHSGPSISSLVCQQVDVLPAQPRISAWPVALMTFKIVCPNSSHLIFCVVMGPNGWSRYLLFLLTIRWVVDLLQLRPSVGTAFLQNYAMVLKLPSRSIETVTPKEQCGFNIGLN